MVTQGSLLPARTVIILVVALVLMIVGAIVFAGPVVRYLNKRAAVAEAVAEKSTDDAAGRQLEVEGSENIGSAVQTHYETVTQWRDRVIVENREVYRDPEAQTPLPAGLAASAHRFDRSLCASGRLDCRTDDGTAAEADDAVGGPQGL
jgi:hypothetical protein